MNRQGKIKPDIIFTSIFARIFLKRLEDGTYIGPWFLLDPMQKWSQSMPKLVHGERKIICQMPAEYDASIEYKGLIISMREMAADITKIPIELIEERAQFFLTFWDYLMMIEQTGHLQGGISMEEFEHLQKALGPGAWEKDIFIKEVRV